MIRFTAQSREKGAPGWEIRLACQDDAGERMSVSLFPFQGMKWANLTYRGTCLQPEDKPWRDRMRRQPFIGSPLMFPTPNRVRNGCFTFRGETVRMEKAARMRDNHGLVYDAAWQCAEPVIGETDVSVSAEIAFQPGDGNYEAFPWKCLLGVTYTLTQDALSLRYRVENRDDRPMPFGFGTHPYFRTSIGDAPVRLRIGAKSIYELAEGKIPTGRLLPVAEYPQWNLNSPAMADSICADHAYTQLDGEPVRLIYPDFHLDILSTEDFRVVQIFTPGPLGMLPEGIEPMIAVENQTCCADAINLNERGVANTGLRVAAPGEICQGEIQWRAVNISRTSSPP